MVRLKETKAQPRILRRLSVLSEFADDPITVGAALLQHHWKRRMEGGTPSAEAVQCCTALLTAKRSLLEDSMHGVNEERKPRIAKYVLRWMKDWFLYQWLHDANTSTGVAPSTDLLFKRYNEITEASVAPEGEDLSSTRSSHRSWAARWRGRWYVRIGHLQATEPMELHERRTKAPAVSMTCKRYTHTCTCNLEVPGSVQPSALPCRHIRGACSPQGRHLLVRAFPVTVTIGDA